MTLAALPVLPSFVPRPESLKRFTLDEYHRALEAGAFDSDERVELLEGWIVTKMTHNPLHDDTVDRVQELIRDRTGKKWRVRIQSAITTQDSEPEPDIVVAAGTPGHYLKRHPGPSDIQLIVEVADSSLDRDRNEKGPLYARAGIPVYWIINLVESVVEVYSDPDPQAPPRYRSTNRHVINDSVPLSLGGEIFPPIPIKEILP